jgi:hypothetical protein
MKSLLLTVMFLGGWAVVSGEPQERIFVPKKYDIHNRVFPKYDAKLQVWAAEQTAAKFARKKLRGSLAVD